MSIENTPPANSGNGQEAVNCPFCSVELTPVDSGDMHCNVCGMDWFEVECEGEVCLQSRRRTVRLTKLPEAGDNINDCIRPTQPKEMDIYTFHREEGFYPIELKDDAQAIANAECNPGTRKVLRIDGSQVWPTTQTDAPSSSTSPAAPANQN